MQIVFLALVLAFALINQTHAGCDNQCSGHGTCLIDDVCKCFDNWGVGLSHISGDCSERICPYELAWIDTPNKKGAFHKYAECAGRGICNRETAECACFDGYEGKACQRTSCPNDCSGHGTCEFINDMAYDDTWDDAQLINFMKGSTKFRYSNWDNNKVRGCVCDATYGDVDCSKRMCPYGTDVLDTRNNLVMHQKYQVQNLIFKPNVHSQFLDPTAGAGGTKTFALTFKSRLNETFTTVPIVFEYGQSTLHELVNDIQLALLSLPNRVIDGVTVAANLVGGSSINDLMVNITFTGNNVQGHQHLLVVEDYECGDGCTPKITGLDLQTRYSAAHSNVTELRLADFNSYECGRRGKCDYTTGLCTCFTGYTGDNCNTLTTLV